MRDEGWRMMWRCEDVKMWWWMWEDGCGIVWRFSLPLVLKDVKSSKNGGMRKLLANSFYKFFCSLTDFVDSTDFFENCKVKDEGWGMKDDVVMWWCDDVKMWWWMWEDGCGIFWRFSLPLVLKDVKSSKNGGMRKLLANSFYKFFWSLTDFVDSTDFFENCEVKDEGWRMKDEGWCGDVMMWRCGDGCGRMGWCGDAVMWWCGDGCERMGWCEDGVGI